MARPARAPVSPTAGTPAELPAQAPAQPAPALSVPVPVPATPVAEPTMPDLFDAAFSEAVAAEVEPGPTAPASAAVPKKPAAQPTTPAEPPTEPPAEPPAPPAEPPQPESPTGEPLPPQPPERSPQPQPQNPPPQPPPQPQPQAQAPRYQEPPLFNTEEATQLQTFYTEWPDVAQATETMIRGMMAQTARRMYQDMAASLAPYLQTIDTLADRSQLSELQTHVTDYDTVATQLTSWAAQQPAYLRSAYEHVIKAGTAAEVVDLINRYKQDTQSPAQRGQAPVAPAAAASVQSPTPAPVSPALAAAAARLAPVSTKRTNVVAPPADFDTAFAEFARAS